MSRRRRAEVREIPADPVYNSTLAEKFVNSMMWAGKKTIAQNPQGKAKSSKGPISIGLDLGDKTSRYCALDSSGEVVKEGSVATA